MNQQILNRTAEQMALAAYGFNGAGFSAARTDTGGKPVASSNEFIPIEADRLAVRNLSGTTDNVLTYSQSWTQDSESSVIVGLGSYDFLTKDVSRYARNTYLVVNTGSVALSINLQIAPADVGNEYVADGSAFDLLTGASHLFEPSKLMKYARIHATALLLGSATVYYFGQT